jgi:hypothetical protein
MGHMSKIKISIQDTAAHPAPANDNTTWKTLGAAVGAVVQRILEGRPVY